MTPEASAFLTAADRAITDARTILAASVPQQAARLAYYAQFHSAQALIFERTGKISKTHKGVHRQLHQLARTEPALPPGFATQLTKSYNYKERADYDTDITEPIMPARAGEAIATAESFIAVVRQALDRLPSSAP